MALEMLKAIRHSASSMATTGSSMLQTGPRALYWRTTISVAAGAVAAAMAPSIRHRGRGKPIAMSATSTSATAHRPSKSVMTIGLEPIWRR